jgi:hypothetical protein
MTAFDVPASIWRKSRHSVANGNCVQVAASLDAVMIRDSADSEGPVISYPAAAWCSFVAAVKIPNPLSRPRKNRSSNSTATVLARLQCPVARDGMARFAAMLITAVRNWI